MITLEGMCGTFIDWIHLGLADSLLMTPQQCQIEMATILPRMTFPTRFAFQILAESACSQNRRSLAKAFTWDLKPILCWNGTSQALPGRRTQFWPEHSVTEVLLDRLFKWDLEHPRTSVCVGMATSTVGLVRTCYLIYVCIVVVGHHINQWCNHTTVWICLKTLLLWQQLFRLPNIQ